MDDRKVHGVPRRFYLYQGPERMFVYWRWMGRDWLMRPCEDWLRAEGRRGAPGACGMEPTPPAIDRLGEDTAA